MADQKLIDEVVDVIMSSPDFDIHGQAELIIERLFPEREPGTTDDKLRPGQTVKEALDRCVEIVDNRRYAASLSPASEPAARAFDKAVEHFESGQMWYARGRHMQEGSFNPSDVDRWIADGKDVQDTVAERDRAAGKKP